MVYTDMKDIIEIVKYLIRCNKRRKRFKFACPSYALVYTTIGMDIPNLHCDKCPQNDICNSVISSVLGGPIIV